MAFELKRKIYEAMPLPVKQGIGLIPFSWVAGAAYRKVYQRGMWFDQAGRDELLRYQEQALGGILRFAVDQVPAYQSLRSIVERLQPFEALKAFPLLDKDVLQANLHRYLPRDFANMAHYKTSTGGTSGNPLKLYLDDCSQSEELGFMHRQWARVGYTPGQRKATFRGVAFPKLKPLVFWQSNPIYNELQFSPFHMSEANLSLYIDALLRYSPAFIHGYPSAIDVLAEYVMRHQLTDKMPRLKAVLLGSEGVSAGQRKRIEQAFQARVYSWYGHTERLVLAGECEKNTAYHHIPDYGILELIDDNQYDCVNEGDRGEIIGTGLLNRCMPLIRYRTGDSATRLAAACDCGRCWDRFTDVEGRTKQDRVIGKSGTLISVAALNMHGDLLERVKRFQFFQDTIGKCTLKLVAAPGFTDKDRQIIELAFKAKAGDEVDFMVQMAEDIPLTARGKFKLLDSRLGGSCPEHK